MTKKQWCLKELLIYPEGTKKKKIITLVVRSVRRKLIRIFEK